MTTTEGIEMGQTSSPGVEELLDLGKHSRLLEQARDRWDDWVEIDGRLAVSSDLDGFFDYLSAASTEAGDRCLLAMAMLAAPDGGDDVAAAATLAKALLPGAIVLASRLTTSLARRGWYPTGTAERGLVSARVDERVASQLWIEVRSFPWRRLTKVGGNILMNTRARVLWECGDHAQTERYEPIWAVSSPVDFWGLGDAAGELEAKLMRASQDHPKETSREVLTDVLAWACAAEVITETDQVLLLTLIDAAAAADELRRTSRGKGNLCSDPLSVMVAADLGISASTIRRRAANTIKALAAAAPAGYSCDR